MTKIICIILAAVFIAHNAHGATAPALGGIDIFQGGINNPTDWVQPTRSYTYTVGADGVSLYHGLQQLPITLNTPATPGTRRSVTDYAIAPRPRNTGGASGGSVGNGGASGGSVGNGGGSGGGASGGSGGNGGASGGGGSGGSGGNGGASGGSGSGGSGGNGGASGGTGVVAPKPAGWKGMTSVQKAGTVLQGVAGAGLVYAGTAGQQEHDGWDLASGVGGGAMTGAAIGSAVPAIGTAVGAVVGGIIGGVISGSQLFSETDCLYDPIIANKEGGPTFTCCNTAFNKGERYAKIGDYMFCDTLDANGMATPLVRQCLQGGQATELSWWDGLWEDDAWSAQCQERWCNNNKPPRDQVVQPIPDTKNFCWNWQIIDGTGSNGGNGGGDTSDPYTTAINRLQSAIRAYEKQCVTVE